MPTTEELSQSAYDFLNAVISFIKMRRNALLILMEALPQQTNCGDEVATILHACEHSYARWAIDAVATPEKMERWFAYSPQERAAFFSSEVAQYQAQKTFLEIEQKERARCLAQGEASKAYRRSKALQDFTFITLCLLAPLIFIIGVVVSKSLWVAIGIAVVLGIVSQALHRYADKRTKNDLQKLQGLTPSSKQPTIDVVALLRKVQERYHPHLHRLEHERSASATGNLINEDRNKDDSHCKATEEGGGDDDEDDDDNDEDDDDNDDDDNDDDDGDGDNGNNEDNEDQEDEGQRKWSTTEVIGAIILLDDYFNNDEDWPF